ncbi:hypothetical protein FRB94_014068 [Tulasnella sp. JGI-2019a]|nr:hypothetical protein FRB93_011335 [Tulasnella sp. JGI-2019a]KAG8989734.1 hypothetical protein FRB94_014068 [Tulasnella sp. JGI-2019a]
MGGIIVVNATLPGASDIWGLWPAVWTLGNLDTAPHSMAFGPTPTTLATWGPYQTKRSQTAPPQPTSLETMPPITALSPTSPANVSHPAHATLQAPTPSIPVQRSITVRTSVEGHPRSTSSRLK